MKNRSTGRHSAFSILELSVVLVIIALVVGFGITGGQNAIEGTDRLTTQNRLKTIQAALDNYAALNGYLPCPANRNLTPSSASFGVEARSGMYCTTGGDLKELPAAAPSIYVGGVPTRTLGLPDAYAADAWSNKFTYVVGKYHVGESSAYLNNDGPITILYGNLISYYKVTTARPTGGATTGTAGAAATYAVISHGPNGKGAYPLNGTAVGVTCEGNGVDVLNCDESNALGYPVGLHENIYDAGIFDTAYADNTDNEYYFDDYVVWGTNALTRSPIASGATCDYHTPAGGTGSACESELYGGGTCTTFCISNGYSSGSALLSNCVRDDGCADPNVTCSYTCCCSGFSNAVTGCPAVTKSWGAGCSATFPDTPSGVSPTRVNTASGYTGSATYSCTAGAWGGAPTSSTCTAATNVPGGCSGGSCQPWCAPCTANGGSPSHQSLCQKIITSNNPCRATCIWAGCAGTTCYSCP
jgi:type II secretory pathway pseudopilin PulG